MAGAHREMRVAFRADASRQIGHGHVMRCLTLADALRDRGASCRFICRAHDGHLAETIRARGHDVRMLDLMPTSEPWLGASRDEDARQSTDAVEDFAPDWLIVDHYAIDASWETQVAEATKRIAVIDDLADRAHACALLVDQTHGRTDSDYAGLVPPECRLLVGADYALVRPEFSRLRDLSLTGRSPPALEKLVVSVGGIDADDNISRVLDSLESVDDIPLSVDVLVSGKAPHLACLRGKVARMSIPTQLIVDAPDFAQRLAEADLAIGAAGSSAWERCTLGLPTLLLVLADNQKTVARGLATAGAAHLIDSTNVDTALPTSIRRLAREPVLLAGMSAAAATITDGMGTERVIEAMEAIP